ncbi:hypothetical protein SynROS8604_02381 [Synechococcus sp. ROS8604]|nr:hypothetical protein SynROS8604_02381 [Synechococcus sp. ROS8604]
MVRPAEKPNHSRVLSTKGIQQSHRLNKSASVLTSADEIQQFTAAGQQKIFRALSPFSQVSEPQENQKDGSNSVQSQ